MIKMLRMIKNKTVTKEVVWLDALEEDDKDINNENIENTREEDKKDIFKKLCNLFFDLWTLPLIKFN